MKVKEYLVSEILDLKHNVRKLQEEIARKDTMIKSQCLRIEYFEKKEEKYKLHNNSLYGDLCEVRKIITDNFLPGDAECSTQDLSINKEDFDKLLKILGLDNAERQEVPDEVPED